MELTGPGRRSFLFVILYVCRIRIGQSLQVIDTASVCVPFIKLLNGNDLLSRGGTHVFTDQGNIVPGHIGQFCRLVRRSGLPVDKRLIYGIKKVFFCPLIGRIISLIYQFRILRIRCQVFVRTVKVLIFCFLLQIRYVIIFRREIDIRGLIQLLQVDGKDFFIRFGVIRIPQRLQQFLRNIVCRVFCLLFGNLREILTGFLIDRLGRLPCCFGRSLIFGRSIHICLILFV